MVNPTHNQPPRLDGPLIPGRELEVAEVFSLENVAPYLTPEDQGGLSDAHILADIVIGSGEYEDRQRLHIFDLRDQPAHEGYTQIQYRGKNHKLPAGTIYWVVDSQNDNSPDGSTANGLPIPQSDESIYVSSEENAQVVADHAALNLASFRLQTTQTGVLEIQNASPNKGYLHIETQGSVPESTKHIRAKAAAMAGSTAVAESVDTTEVTKPPLHFTSGFAEISKREAMQASRDYSDEQINQVAEKSQDRVFVDTENHVYAVFDGMGGHEKGGEAANAARDCLANYVFDESYDSEEAALADMRQALDLANTAVIKEAEGGGTTATVVRIANVHSRGKTRQFIIWGSVGDSRVYVANRGERLEQLEQLSIDEGVGHEVGNALGKVNGMVGKVRQVGCTWLMPGDRILIVSDGVTGDRAYDNIDPEVLQGTLLGAKTPEEAADIFVNWLARKIDDRSAIVIFANAKNNARSPATRT